MKSITIRSVLGPLNAVSVNKCFGSVGRLSKQVLASQDKWEEGFDFCHI